MYLRHFPIPLSSKELSGQYTCSPLFCSSQQPCETVQVERERHAEGYPVSFLVHEDQNSGLFTKAKTIKSMRQGTVVKIQDTVSELPREGSLRGHNSGCPSNKASGLFSNYVWVEAGWNEGHRRKFFLGMWQISV